MLSVPRKAIVKRSCKEIANFQKGYSQFKVALFQRYSEGVTLVCQYSAKFWQWGWANLSLPPLIPFTLPHFRAGRSEDKDKRTCLKLNTSALPRNPEKNQTNIFYA